jgi:putative membrane protein
MNTAMTLLNNMLADGRMGPMMRGGGFFFGQLMELLWTILIVLAVLWVVRNWSSITASLRRTASSMQPSSAAPVTPQTPLEIVQIRYAKGEITREEYETLRRDLLGEPPAAAPPSETVAA